MISRVRAIQLDRAITRMQIGGGAAIGEDFLVSQSERIPWAVGTTLLEVSEPRIPCWRLGVRMNDPVFPRRFTEALRPGPYLRIVVEGDVGAGDEIRFVERPDHGLTVRDVFRIYTRDRGEARRLLTIPGMSESWQRWARDVVQKASAAAPGCCEATAASESPR